MSAVHVHSYTTLVAISEHSFSQPNVLYECGFVQNGLSYPPHYRVQFIQIVRTLCSRTPYSSTLLYSSIAPSGGACINPPIDADIRAPPFENTAYRVSTVLTTYRPIYSGVGGVVTRRVKVRQDLWAMFSPFDTELWGGIVGLIFLTARTPNHYPYPTGNFFTRGPRRWIPPHWPSRYGCPRSHHQ